MMKMRNALLLSMLATLSPVGSTLTSAHHSTAAFDSETVVRIEGTVTQVRWINPHATFKVDGDASDHYPAGVWTIEMTAPNVLINQGWKRNSVSTGDRVTVLVNPLHNPIALKDGSQGGLYVGIILADGSSLGRVDDAPND
jgi:hypothetical protein